MGSELKLNLQAEIHWLPALIMGSSLLSNFPVYLLSSFFDGD